MFGIAGPGLAHHLEKPSSGEEHHSPIGPGAELPGDAEPEPFPVEADGSFEVDRVDNGPTTQDFHGAPSVCGCNDATTVTGSTVPRPGVVCMGPDRSLVGTRGVSRWCRR